MLLLSLKPFALSGLALSKTAYSKAVLNNTVIASSYTFTQNQEEAVIRTGDRQISAFILQEDKVLTIEGIDEIEFREFGDQELLTIDFRLTSTRPDKENESEIKGYKTELKLSEDPIYWRLDTSGKVYGIGNTELLQPEKLNDLLPTVLQGIKAEFYTRRQWDNTIQVQMSLKGDTEKEAGFYSPDRINTSSLPKELRELVVSDDGISKLELKANYDMEIPLVLKGEHVSKDTPFIKLKLTLVTHIEISND